MKTLNYLLLSLLRVIPFTVRAVIVVSSLAVYMHNAHLMHTNTSSSRNTALRITIAVPRVERDACASSR